MSRSPSRRLSKNLSTTSDAPTTTTTTILKTALKDPAKVYDKRVITGVDLETKILEALGDGYTDEDLNEYLDYLEKKYDVSQDDLLTRTFTVKSTHDVPENTYQEDMLMFGRFNKNKHNVKRDAIIVIQAICNELFNDFTGFISTLGKALFITKENVRSEIDKYFDSFSSKEITPKKYFKTGNINDLTTNTAIRMLKRIKMKNPNNSRSTISYYDGLVDRITKWADTCLLCGANCTSCSLKRVRNYFVPPRKGGTKKFKKVKIIRHNKNKKSKKRTNKRRRTLRK